MARIKKKGTSGNAKNFITRTQAVNKLQVSLADFRRLCIFKGIYPREPRNKKKANKGSTAPVTFYYAKDIQYLLHEPVLQKFREHKTFARKLQRALGRGEVGDAQRLEENRPKYTLDHLVKERYPTFADSLRDLDDPLNMLFLFANMPATDRVSHRVTKEAEKLCNQWLAYVAKERLIKKVFVSIKGVYYEANVRGQEVRWLQPFKFPQNIPLDVDFRIMLTFLEFYSTLLHFVLYKLYHDAGLAYPPQLDENVKVGGLSQYILKQKNSLVPQDKREVLTEEGKHLSTEEISKAIAANKQGDDDNEVNDENVENVDLDEFGDTKGDALSQPNKFALKTLDLFSKFTFYVGREVALDLVELPILACGGKLVLEIACDELQVNNPEAYARLDFDKITHHITDRPKLLEKVQSRTYIQPQWVFDCVNKAELVPVNQYAPGETLPPHLSPWGDLGTYNPEAEVEAQDEEEEEEEVDDDEDVEVDADEEDEEEDADLVAQKELEMEAAGVKFSEAPTPTESLKKSKKRKATDEDEEKELKKIMMTNKQRKLYDKMQYSNQQKADREKELKKKKVQLEKKKQQLKK